MATLSRAIPSLRRASITAGSIPEIEADLVRRSVLALTAGRAVCHHCRRTPLIGEVVDIYGEALVCELCRPLRRAAPDRSARVRSPEHERVVRQIPRPSFI
jgi:hypothetical protein